MTDATPAAQAPPFRAVLTPHRSLGPTGFLILMLLFGGVSFIAGIFFAVAGAWPVLGFFGLDVLILYVAFKLNYRSGRLYETLEVSRTDVTLVRTHPSGRTETFASNPFYARVDFSERPDGHTSVALRDRDRTFPFATFLTDEERKELAKELIAQLALARDGRLA